MVAATKVPEWSLNQFALNGHCNQSPLSGRHNQFPLNGRRNQFPLNNDCCIHSRLRNIKKLPFTENIKMTVGRRASGQEMHVACLPKDRRAGASKLQPRNAVIASPLA
ncbi:hypothetical protein PoB_000353700 [Plakobranchus ocellatus]|uniref:Uncharacterized protein n=1 Tax=Plakobranchus ocellatus TaxID=259542 RepID=A0AAV3Y4L9_9GAST|nr:hypothetical protein PoB_000353700 [Plakobranchus ocellatus]